MNSKFYILRKELRTYMIRLKNLFHLVAFPTKMLCAFSKKILLHDSFWLVNKKVGIMFALPAQYIQI